MAYQNLASASALPGCQGATRGQKRRRERGGKGERDSKPSRNLNMEHNFHPKHVVGKSLTKNGAGPRRRHDGCQQQQQKQQQHGAATTRGSNCTNNNMGQVQTAHRGGKVVVRVVPARLLLLFLLLLSLALVRQRLWQSHVAHTTCTSPAILGMPCNYFGLKFVFCTNLVNASCLSSTASASARASVWATFHMQTTMPIHNNNNNINSSNNLKKSAQQQRTKLALNCQQLSFSSCRGQRRLKP